MVLALTIASSILIYGIIAWRIYENKGFLHIFQWASNPTISLIWLMWVLFLFIFSPLVYLKGDMFVHTDTVLRLMNGSTLPGYYVYLPVYAQFLAGIALPFNIANILSPLLLVYVVNGFVVFGYAYSAKLMSALLPSRADLAPLAIILAPVSILHLFAGTNHVVMLMLLLASLLMVQRGHWLLAGIFGFLSCYKFVLLPTIFVLIVIILIKAGYEKTISYCAGCAIAAVPSIAYFLIDPQKFTRLVGAKAALGAHSAHIERFHFLYGISKLIDGFENWYIGNDVWFYIVVLGSLLSIFLYWTKKVNTLQALALSYAFVCLFAVEPFRIEPLIGLLWLDAIHRNDQKLQLATLIIIFVHAGIWMQYAYPQNLDFDITTPFFFWTGRGLYLGTAVIASIILIVNGRPGTSLLFSQTGK